MPAPVAIVHDYLTQRGGAERVVLALSRLFPGAPIYTSLYDPDRTYDDFRALDVRPSFLQRLPHGNERALLPLYPAAFGLRKLRGHDLVVSSSSGFAHGVDAGGSAHVCYCYTPPRWLYDGGRYAGEGGPVPAVLRPLLPLALAPLRAWDARAARRPTAYVAASGATADRIEAVYGRRATVVHPPVPLRPLRPDAGDGGYFLTVARLLPYKRVDLAIAAAERLGVPLVVVGSGPAREHLARSAGPLVEFRDRVGDEELSSLLARCTALVQPGEEDFGLMPLEANGAGRPVVALAQGGALETVVDGRTGRLVDSPSVEAFAEAMAAVAERSWDPVALRSHAERFGEPAFHARFLSAIGEDLGREADVGSALEALGSRAAP